MNSIIVHMSSIVCCARKALYKKEQIKFISNESIKSVKFVFLSVHTLLKTIKANSVAEWYNLCLKNGLSDIKYFLDIENYPHGTIVCFWNDKSASCFVPEWQIDKQHKGWNVIYKEQEISISKNDFVYNDRIKEFKSILWDISNFADKIRFSHFSNIFRKAYSEISDAIRENLCPIPEYIPNEFNGIYCALNTANVFGGMGSWNDSPAYRANEMGLKMEYDMLSDKLFEQITYHLLYLTNECWQ